MGKAELIYQKLQGLPDSTQTAVLQMVESLSDNGSEAQAGPRSGLAEKCHQLAETWRRETGFFSFMQQRACNPPPISRSIHWTQCTEPASPANVRTGG